MSAVSGESANYSFLVLRDCSGMMVHLEHISTGVGIGADGVGLAG